MIKKPLFSFLCLLFFLEACLGPAEQKTVTTRTPASLSAKAPAKWSMARFPLTLKISDQFTAPEKQALGQMALEWSRATGQQIQYFNVASDATPEKNAANLKDYNDGVMGIYKSKLWYNALSPSALAVTQFFGIRRNVGTGNEYIELTHADIILNDSDPDMFQYSLTKSPWAYDLPSIILHEMGHFLGQYHQYDDGVSSVMSPYLDTNELVRSTYTYDKNSLSDKYLGTHLVNNTSQNSGSAMVLNQVPNYKEGDEVHALIEIKKSNCSSH